MKKMKNLLSFVLALVMVMAMGLTAMAAEGGPEPSPDGSGESTASVTINEELKGHTFTAYQIFSGTQADGSEALASIEWGDGINREGFVNALKALDAVTFAKCNAADPQSVAEAISTVSSESDMAKKIAEAAADNLSGEGTTFNSETKLPKGYYLIKDTTENLNGNAAYNDVVLQLTTTVEIQYKTAIPTSEKKVQDNDSTAWVDSADWNIGGEVPFQIKGTLPNNYGDYDKYTIKFHDVEEQGLSFNVDSVIVTVRGKTLTKSTEGMEGDYQVVVSGLTDRCTFEIVIPDLKKSVPEAEAGDEVVVTYKSNLNEQAAIGPTGNANEMTMEFSNNAHGEGTGTTPKDRVVVFTYDLIVNKVQPDSNTGEENKYKPLEGAGFTLYKKVSEGDNVLEGHEGNYIVVKTFEVAANQTQFDFKGLDDGDYVLVETTVPAGYNKADDISFTITATHDVESADPKLLTFTATGNDGTSVNEEGTTVTGKIETDVVNQRGVTLPETGGIGTTIFYVAGVILVIVAGVLLVTKKRMSKEQ